MYMCMCMYVYRHVCMCVHMHIKILTIYAFMYSCQQSLPWQVIAKNVFYQLYI